MTFVNKCYICHECYSFQDPRPHDAQSLPKDLYGVSAIPHLILFAPDGTILMRGLRGEQIYAVPEDLL